MAVVITGRYTGALGTRVRHEQSRAEFETAAPLDPRRVGALPLVVRMPADAPSTAHGDVDAASAGA